MRVNVLYFAQVREALGAREALTWAPEDEDAPATVGALRAWLIARSPAHARALDQTLPLRCACNQVMCGPDEPLTDGAEVAFFPPVTGG